MLDSKLSGFSSAQINKKRFRVGEEIVRGLLFLAAFLSVITTFSIVAVLAQEAATFFSEVSFWDFLSGTKWTPLLEPRSFGVLPLVCGTLLIVVGAALIAIPIGLASAIYLAEYLIKDTYHLLLFLTFLFYLWQKEHYLMFLEPLIFFVMILQPLIQEK